MSVARSHWFTDRIAFWALAAAVGGAPLPFGSRDTSVVAVWCGLLGIGLVFAPLRHLRRPHLWMLGVIGLLVASYAVVLHEQLSTTPWIAAFHPVWAHAEQILAAPVQPAVSIVRYEPFFAVGAPLANILALSLGLIVGTDRGNARAILKTVAWAGVVHAVYGLYAMVADPMTILGHERPAYIGNLTGTFINRNTAATYFGSVSIVWFLMVLEQARKLVPEEQVSWARFWTVLSTDDASRHALLVPFAMLFLCLTATFLTVSRAGTMLTVFVLALTFAIHFRRRVRASRGLLFVGAAAAVATMIFLLFGGGVGSRFEAEGLSDGGRTAAWASTLKIISDQPWFGTGLGTFAWAFPAYRGETVSMWGVWDMAHSTPLELASEVGVPLALLLGLFWCGALLVLVRGAIMRRRDRLIPLTAFGVGLLGILHSTVDFSLQVPGYGIVAFGLVGIGLAHAVRTAPPQQQGHKFIRHN
ncbi:O-antigen ligase family protein [Rhodoplanes roseus]|uniref:Ligase n=1 Tax=Rhodoplanes roseus TaxID=29409 RepID=A0A327L136_9BRAD|nr:O-antigen ligase family protein [Rhodoplanes roseus]RAI43665.1 ligase [Rhodoplanes roseus]